MSNTVLTLLYTWCPRQYQHCIAWCPRRPWRLISMNYYCASFHIFSNCHGHVLKYRHCLGHQVLQCQYCLGDQTLQSWYCIGHHVVQCLYCLGHHILQGVYCLDIMWEGYNLGKFLCSLYMFWLTQTCLTATPYRYGSHIPVITPSTHWSKSTVMCLYG